MSSNNSDFDILNLGEEKSIQAMAAEFEALKNQIKELKAWKESHLEVARQGVFSSPISIAVSQSSPAIAFTTPSSQIPPPQVEKSDETSNFDLFKNGKLNNAAMAIIHQTMAAREWQGGDLEDCPNILNKINCDFHYLSHCRRKKGEPIKCSDGSTCETFLLLFRKFFVEKEDLLSPSQGKDLQRLMKRMFSKREETQHGDEIRLDPARKEFTSFIGDICLGKLVNPKIPRLTGTTAHDFNVRVAKIANKIRCLFFGSPEDFSFECLKEDGSKRVIHLPTIEELQREVKDKLSDKEGSESKYINKWLKPFDFYIESKGSNPNVPEDRTHELSRDVIDSWRENKKLKGFVTAVLDSGDGVMEEGNSTPATKKARKVTMTSAVRIATNQSFSSLSRSGLTSSTHHQDFSSSVRTNFNEESLFDKVLDKELDEYAQPPAKTPVVGKSVSKQVPLVAFSSQYHHTEEPEDQRDSGDEADEERRRDAEVGNEDDMDGGGEFNMNDSSIN